MLFYPCRRSEQERDTLADINNNKSPLYACIKNNNHKGFFDLFFFPVGWMSDGMTDMNGGWQPSSMERS